MVLSQYKLTVKIGELVLEKHEVTKEFQNKLLTDVEEQLSKQSSNNLKIDKVQKREYHTSSISRSEVKDITISPKSLQNKWDENSTVKYLMTINDVLHNKDYSDEVKQRILEEDWFNLITERHDDLEYLTQRYSPKLVNKLTEAKKTLDIMYKNGI